MPLPWFRRKKPEGPAPTTAAAAAPHTPELTITESRSGRAGGEAPTSASAPKKRRRGTRGGRNRKRKTAAEAAPAAAAAGREGASREGGRRRQEEDGRAQDAAPQQPRRRQAPKRAPLPKAKRELLDLGRRGREARRRARGRQGRRGLPRAARAAVDRRRRLPRRRRQRPARAWRPRSSRSGSRRTASSTSTRSSRPSSRAASGARKIQDLIQRGQTVLVQAVKDPMKTKGARLTTEISLPGRFVVYVPHGEGLGVSRRLEDDERTRLKAILKECAPKKGGVIVRTAAEGASAEDIERDLDFLQRLWKSIEAQREGVDGAGAPLPGGGAAAARRARPVHRRLRAAATSTTTAPTSGSSAT